jgi:integrase
LGQLTKFAGIDLDVSRLAGSYSPSSVTPRDLMSDAEIAQWYQKIPNPQWRCVFGLMATYGFRNHEVFHIDLDSLKENPGILVVRAGKTGAREEWWQQWRLWEVNLPEVTGRDNSALGMRVTQALKRYGFWKPYNLRHAGAVRTLEFGLPIELAAAQMGHSLSVHSRIYHRWIKRDHHQRIFDLLINRHDRQLPP